MYYIMCRICEFKHAFYALQSEYDVDDKAMGDALEYLSCECDNKDCEDIGECDCIDDDSKNCLCYLTDKELKKKKKKATTQDKRIPIYNEELKRGILTKKQYNKIFHNMDS
jgi:hypothetical protein